jgi:hypothetical protein
LIEEKHVILRLAMRGLSNLLLLIAWAAACSSAPEKKPPVVADTRLVPATTASAPTAEPSADEPPPPLPPPERPAHTIANIKLTFELPSTAWKRHPGLGPPKEGVTQVGFERDPVFDDQGNGVKPFCGITSEPVPREIRDVVKYSLSWRLRVPFKVDEVFSHEDGTIQVKNAIGYRGHTEYGGQEHTLYVVHAVFRDRGFVVVCDSTKSVFAQVKGELDAFLKSMRHTEAP